jgi:hypothetical protein
VFWVRGAAAEVWWHDWAHARSCMCVTPSDSARWARRVARAWADNPPTPYVLEPRIGLVTLIYPAAGRAPAYGLTPDALGSGVRAWNMRFFPTKQMQRILASGSTTATNIAAAPAPTVTSAGRVTWVWIGIAGAVELCTAVVALPPTRRLAGRAITARQ